MGNFSTRKIDHTTSIVGYILIVFFICIAYSNITIQNFLEWDDTHYVLTNQHIQSFTIKNILWMFTDFSMGNWHPVTWLSYVINYILWGDNPLPYKIINIVIHILNSALVYIISFRLLKHVKNSYHSNLGSALYDVSNNELQYASIFVGILFSIHPLHVESVSWISERKDVLYSFFFLLTIICYLNYKEEHLNKKWFILSIIMFLLSLGSKSMSVTTPAILVLIDIYPLNLVKKNNSLKDSLKLLFHDKITFILLAILVSLIALLTQTGAIKSAGILSLDSRIINACMSIFQYLFHFLYPANLSTFYSFQPWAKDPNIFSAIPIFAFVVITGFFIYLAKSKKVYFPFVCWLYFIIALLPVIGIVKVGGQASADRYTYMPLLSAYVVFAAFVAIIWHKAQIKLYHKYTVLVVLFSWIVLLTHFTYLQNAYWKNDETLWMRAISLDPGNSDMPYSNLGAIYINSRNTGAAIIALNKSIDIQPLNSGALLRLGQAYELMGKDKQAMYAYKKIIRTLPNDATGYVSLGDFYYRHQNIDEAKYFYKKAFTMVPNLPATLERSALVDFLDHNYKSAEIKLNYVLQLIPNDKGSMQILANTKLNMGQVDAAKDIAQNILAEYPNDTFAIQFLNDLDKSNKK